CPPAFLVSTPAPFLLLLLGSPLGGAASGGISYVACLLQQGAEDGPRRERDDRQQNPRDTERKPGGEKPAHGNPEQALGVGRLQAQVAVDAERDEGNGGKAQA